MGCRGRQEGVGEEKEEKVRRKGGKGEGIKGEGERIQNEHAK